MEEIDKALRKVDDDEELLMREVICGEAELLYLDSYLCEVFRS